jgi:hypothetical protein
MKVVVQSSSLIFTVLSIVLNVPITKVKRKSPETENRRESSKNGIGEDSRFPSGTQARHSTSGS